MARYDPAWALPEQLGGHGEPADQADANNWDRADTRFPFLRSHDAYAGHSWAAGHGDFGDGNNQESSSESMNFATAAILWGEATGQTDIRDLGVYPARDREDGGRAVLVRRRRRRVPRGLPACRDRHGLGRQGRALDVVRRRIPSSSTASTFCPCTAGSLYLGRHYPDSCARELQRDRRRARNGQPIIWQDLSCGSISRSPIANLRPILLLRRHRLTNAVRRRVARAHAALAL